MQDIDLHPKDWSSERPKPKEPFFGQGWPVGLATAGGILIAAWLADGSGRVPFWAAMISTVGVAVIFHISDSLRR